MVCKRNERCSEVPRTDQSGRILRRAGRIVEDVNKIDFIIRDDQDILDAITDFPHLAHNTWVDKGDLALFSDLGPTGINKKTCH